MSIPAEFHEREYESLFIQELSKLGSFTWSPGQTEEHLLGFDGAVWINPDRLCRFGFPRPASRPPSRRHFWWWHDHAFWRGELLSPELMDEWRHYAESFFPPKALNLFVQHKRPHQSSEQAAAGDYWKQAYYEYRIETGQQARLEKLESHLGSSGVVTYACAAFLGKRDLWECERTGSLVQSSNFAAPSKLSGHSRFTFIEAGHRGFANADPTPVENIPLLERIISAYEGSEGGLSAQIKAAGKAVHSVMISEDPESDGLYFQLLTRLLGEFEEMAEDETLFGAISRVLAFNTVNSTSWVIMSRPKIDSA